MESDLPPEVPLLTNGTGITLEKHCAQAYEWWRRIGSPKRVLAPMVEQSELVLTPCHRITKSKPLFYYHSLQHESTIFLTHDPTRALTAFPDARS